MCCSNAHWLAICATCEVGFYSNAGGDLFRTLWGLEVKSNMVWPSKVTQGSKSLSPYRVVFSSSSEDRISLLWCLDQMKQRKPVPSLLLFSECTEWRWYQLRWKWLSGKGGRQLWVGKAVCFYLRKPDNFQKKPLFVAVGMFPLQKQIRQLMLKFCLLQELLSSEATEFQ